MKTITLFIVLLGIHGAEGLQPVVLGGAEDLLQMYQKKAEVDACYQNALSRLDGTCPKDDLEQRQELAFFFTNCQLRMDGLSLVQCSNGARFCPNTMSDKQYQLFCAIRLHLDTMCHFISYSLQLSKIHDSTHRMHNLIEEAGSVIHRLERTVAITSGKMEASVGESLRLLNVQSEKSNTHFLQLAMHNKQIQEQQQDISSVAQHLSTTLDATSEKAHKAALQQQLVLESIADTSSQLFSANTNHFQHTKERSDQVINLLDRVYFLLKIVSGTATYFSSLYHFAVSSFFVYLLGGVFRSHSGRSAGLIANVCGLLTDILWLKQPPIADGIRLFVSTSAVLSYCTPSDSLDADAFPSFLSDVNAALFTAVGTACVMVGWALHTSMENNLSNVVRTAVSEALREGNPQVPVRSSVTRRSESPRTARKG